MSDKIDKEIEAIKTILTTLQSLDDEVRKNVLEYVLKRINFNPVAIFTSQQQSNPGEIFTIDQFANSNAEQEAVHIKKFKESKGPKSAIEMAALVAYFLQYLAPTEDRKDKVNTSDLETWFRIADFPLPKGDMKFVLVNTKNAGYFDNVGSGDFKLNAVGYNLIKHNLPRKENQIGTGKRVKKATKKPVKKASKKSTKK